MESRKSLYCYKVEAGADAGLPDSLVSPVCINSLCADTVYQEEYKTHSL